jgi:hypothetical protein
VAELDTAAEHAAGRGGTAAAAELAELAAELTPSESAAERRRRRHQAASFHRFAGDFARACAIWKQLLTEVAGGVERADVLYALANTGVAGLPERIWLCEEAVAEAAGDDARAAPILGFLRSAAGWEATFRARSATRVAAWSWRSGWTTRACSRRR